jgi:hypothetical protein
MRDDLAGLAAVKGVRLNDAEGIVERHIGS